ncbi:MAG: VOC family protein [Bacteroidetes bacterium]|nr:MAG: VOC family protein [Bacteroidota bacterium]
MLWVPDVEESIKFYVEKLGFRCSNYVPEAGWGIIRRDHVAIMLAKPNAHSAFTGAQFTGSLYLNTDDVDAFWQSVKDTVTVEYPIETFEYGMREFAIRDNNGYMLQFGQNIEKNF